MRSGNIAQHGLNSNLDNMDAVFTWRKNGKTYIFKDGRYWRYNEDRKKLDRGYPRFIQRGWPDLPNNIDAAVTWRNGRSYIFTGDNYLKLKNYSQNRKVYKERGYPRKTTRGWMKCSVGALAGALMGNADP